MSLGYVVLVGVGCAVTILSCWHCREAWASRTWVRTKGIVCKTSIDYQGGGEIDRPKKKHSFFPNVIYRYEVNAKEYSNDRLHFGLSRGSEEQAQAVATYYWEGREVDVMYNPKNPRQSVLKPGLCPLQLLPLGFGAILLVGGCLGLMPFQLQGWIG